MLPRRLDSARAEVAEKPEVMAFADERRHPQREDEEEDVDAVSMLEPLPGRAPDLRRRETRLERDVRQGGEAVSLRYSEGLCRA
jgi:hypothetical protein